MDPWTQSKVISVLFPLYYSSLLLNMPFLLWLIRTAFAVRCDVLCLPCRRAAVQRPGAEEGGKPAQRLRDDLGGSDRDLRRRLLPQVSENTQNIDTWPVVRSYRKGMYFEVVVGAAAFRARWLSKKYNVFFWGAVSSMLGVGARYTASMCRALSSAIYIAGTRIIPCIESSLIFFLCASQFEPHYIRHPHYSG